MENRFSYVSGSGQLCEDCYREWYKVDPAACYLSDDTEDDPEDSSSLTLHGKEAHNFLRKQRQSINNL